ncbi:MAG: PDZ domain-containing protein [Corynebacterium sp.]|nr:PDZ domain-containing protein [Corynebacterium sp.]
MKAKLRTVLGGLIPVAVLVLVSTVDHIPGTNIELTVPYAAEGPGPTYNTLGEVDGRQVVDISGTQVDPTTGNLNMTTVSVRTNLSLAMALERWIVHRDSLVPIEQIIPSNMTTDQVNQQNQQAFASSEDSATIAALQYLGKPLAVSVYNVIANSGADGKLQVGDTLLSIDGQAVTSGDQVRQLVRAKKPGDTVDITYSRKGETGQTTIILGKASENDDNTPLLGITMDVESADGIKINYNLNDIGGPSAGLMFTLAVIDKLTPGELTGGDFIAGTGTISNDGTVGPIGGIVHKMEAAKEAGAQIFLVPKDNCAEALTRSYGDMKIVKVDNLADAVNQVKAAVAGDDYARCTD